MKYLSFERLRSFHFWLTEQSHENDQFTNTPGFDSFSLLPYLQGQHLPVDAIEEGHGWGPGAETSNVTTHFLSILKVVVIHGQVGLQQLHCFSVDGVL